MSKPYETLFIKHCGIAYEKQWQLEQQLDHQSHWEFDIAQGILQFGDNQSFDVQVLGTQIDESDLWIWSWANDTDQISSKLLVAALTLREYGTEHDIIEFTEPALEILDRRNGHHFAMIASSLMDARGYYRIPYAGGALFVLLMGDPPIETSPPVQSIATTFPQLIQSMRVKNHMQALEAYMQAKGLSVKVRDQAITGSDHDQMIHAEFDQDQRLTQLTSKSQ